MLAPHRRPLILAAVCGVVAVCGTIAAVTRGIPEVGLHTSDGPSGQRELTLLPGDPPITQPAEAPTAARPAGTTTTSAAPTTSTTIPPVTAPALPSTLTGRVTDTHAQPVEGICVYWMAEQAEWLLARTDADGSYRTQQGSGVPLVFAQCPNTVAEFGWVTQRVAQATVVQPGETGVLDVTITEAGGVRGQVIDLDGNPVANLCMRSTTIDGSISPATDADGRFELPGVVPGDQSVWPAIGLDQCPTVGIWDEAPTAHVVSGEWTDVTMVMTSHKPHPGPPFD